MRLARVEHVMVMKTSPVLLSLTAHMNMVKELDLSTLVPGICSKSAAAWSHSEQLQSLTREMEPPWMKEGLSVGLLVGMSGGGEGMLGGRVVRLNVTRTPSLTL